MVLESLSGAPEIVSLDVDRSSPGIDDLSQFYCSSESDVLAKYFDNLKHPRLAAMPSADTLMRFT